MADPPPSKRSTTVGCRTAGSAPLLQPCVLTWMGNHDLRLLLQLVQCSLGMRQTTNEAHQGPRWVQGLRSRRVKHLAMKLLTSKKTTTPLQFSPAYQALCEMDTERDTEGGDTDHAAPDYYERFARGELPVQDNNAERGAHAQLLGMEGEVMPQLAQLLDKYRIPHRWVPLLLIVLGHLSAPRVRALMAALAGVDVKHRAPTTHTVLTLLCSPVVYRAWTFRSAGPDPPPIDSALAPHAFVHETQARLQQLQTNPLHEAVFLCRFRCEGTPLGVQLVVDEPGKVELRIGAFEEETEEPGRLHGEGAVITSIAVVTSESLADAPPAADSRADRYRF